MSVFRRLASVMLAALVFVSGAALAQFADLSITKSVNNPTPNVGDTITFSVTLANSGPDTATGVTVQDLLPAGLTFVSATPPQGTYSSATGQWAVGAMAVGASATLTIQTVVTSPTAQDNTAAISSSDQSDPNAGNNNSSATVTPQQTDLALAKSVNNPMPNVGDTVSFTVTLANNGPDAATNVTVQDLLPAGLTFVSATPSQGAYNNGTGVWTLGTVTTATPQTLVIQATVASLGAKINTATITHSDQFDPNATNNTASATVTAGPLADLALTKTSSTVTPGIGANFTWTVTVSNLGPDTATNVTVQDLLPPGVAFVSAIASQGAYNNGTGAWTIGTIANGANATLALNVTAGPPATLTNSATVSHSDQSDANSANNAASSTVTIGTQTSIPTLSPWMLFLLMGMLVALGAKRLRA